MVIPIVCTLLGHLTSGIVHSDLLTIGIHWLSLSTKQLIVGISPAISQLFHRGVSPGAMWLFNCCDYQLVPMASHGDDTLGITMAMAKPQTQPPRPPAPGPMACTRLVSLMDSRLFSPWHRRWTTFFQQFFAYKTVASTNGAGSTAGSYWFRGEDLGTSSDRSSKCKSPK